MPRVDDAKQKAQEAEALNRAWRIWNRMMSLPARRAKSASYGEPERLSRPVRIQDTRQSAAEAKRLRRCWRNLVIAGMASDPGAQAIHKALHSGVKVRLNRYVKAAIKPSDQR